MVEVMVAMTLFAMALGGLFPVLVEYSRQVQRLEKCSPQCGRWTTSITGNSITWSLQEHDPIYYSVEPADGKARYTKLPSHAYNQYSYPDQWHLVAADDPWMWKLGAAAVLVPDLPNTSTPPSPSPYLRPFPYTTVGTSAGTVGLVADDGNAVTGGTYSEESGFAWIDGPATGYKDLCRRLAATGPSASWAASWKFKNVQPGWYEVLVTWPDPTALPKPTAPNDTAATSVAYRILDGSGTKELGNTNTAATNLSQLDPPSGSTYDGANWQAVLWNTSSTKPQTWIYIPPREVADNYTTNTDQNGHPVTLYQGDTITVQIQVPPASSLSFVTADGMRLVARTPNTIKRPAPLAWTWTYTSGSHLRTVSGSVTVTNSHLP